MEENEDGIIPLYTVRAVLKQGGIEPDDIMSKRLEKLEQEKLRDLVYYARDYPGEIATDYIRLRQILAYMYQVAGMHDCPDSIMDVLADPEGATEEQVNAMLPYQAHDPDKWTVIHNGQSVTAESLTKVLLEARELRTQKEQQVAIENLAKGIEALDAECDAEALDAKRYRFRKQFLADGGAIMFSANGCQFRMKGDLLTSGATEEEALDLAMVAQP